MNTDGLIVDPSRPTSQKNRFIAGQQQLLRTDIEKTHSAAPDITHKLKTEIDKHISDVKAIILSDYGKGVLSDEIISHVMTAAKKLNIPVFVDPKGNNYARYAGAFMITPNRAELSGAFGADVVNDDAAITHAAQKVLSLSGAENILVTRSERGMTLVQKNSSAPIHFSTQAREVFDVSGAGDTVIATLAAAISVGMKINDAAHISNIAAGIAVGKVGTTPVSVDEILLAMNETNISSLLSWDAAKDRVKKWQAQGLTVGFTNGCFDIIHAGHVGYLRQARAKCDRLIVGLNHDVSVKILKGETRPVNDENARAAVMGALSSVDGVVLFGANKKGEDNTPCALIDHIRPDIFFKGGDYKIENLPEAKIVHAYGGTVDIMNMFDGFSTTNVIARMK